jgi:collagenase-like PrtC family protease
MLTPASRATHIHAARVYLAQSRAFTARARAFSFTLLQWAANARRRAQQARHQLEIFK